LDIAGLNQPTNQPTVVLSCGDKCFLLVQSRGISQLWLRFLKYITIFTLCVK